MQILLFSVMPRSRPVPGMPNLSLQAPYIAHDTGCVNESHRETEQPAFSYASQLVRCFSPVESRFSYLEVCAGKSRPDERFLSNLEGSDNCAFDRFSGMSERTELCNEASLVQSGISSRVSESTFTAFFQSAQKSFSIHFSFVRICISKNRFHSRPGHRASSSNIHRHDRQQHPRWVTRHNTRHPISGGGNGPPPPRLIAGQTAAAVHVSTRRA